MSDSDQYLQMFFDEARKYIQILNESILNLENNPDNIETINALFRAAHSLKGMSATMGFDVLTELTHKLENLMDKVRDGKLEITTELIDLLLAGIDNIENIVNQIKETGEEDINLDQYLEETAFYLKGDSEKKEKNNIGNQNNAEKITLTNNSDNSNSSKEENTSSSGNTGGSEVSSTVRVDIKKLDNLMNMIGELLINKTRLQSLNITDDDFNEVLLQLDRVTMELHHTAMQIRMESVGVIFNRFPRMVRDLSKEESKEINFVMKGEDTELDRSIIDELGDPMTHLLRNAIDHGIEEPEKRVKKGKKEEGTLSLRAYQKGSEIIIEVEDDGAGINRDKLVEKALGKGLTTPEAIEEMDEQEELQLVFHPGLSTSEEVSDVSGRGVGMDVVKSTIEGLDGEVFIESRKDKGTKFTISLPLTLAITEALMVKIDKEVFAIPLTHIQEKLMIKYDDIKMVKGKEVINRRGQNILLLDSRKSLNLDTDYGLYRQQEEFPVVIIQSEVNQFALIVDELLQQQEIVIKSLGDNFKNVDNISGATIIGDGEVALILDVRNIA